MRQSAPDAIERESMEIIESLLPPGLSFSAGERTVVKRIIHALGDPQIAGQVRFHPEALDAGLAAIRRGQPLFTDVRMVAAGISRPLARRFGCRVRCALKNNTIKPAAKSQQTRSAAAFHGLGTALNGAVVAIGNAPTALLALLELVDSGITPSLVIGMPVGFVKAAEAKAELCQRNIPYITIAGRRGGSPAAAAAVNALLRLALEAAS